MYETPHNANFLLEPEIRKEIGRHLSTRLSKYRTASDPTEELVPRDTVLLYLPARVRRFGKIRWGDGEGDVMHAADVVTMAENARDATYIRVGSHSSVHAHR